MALTVDLPIQCRRQGDRKALAREIQAYVLTLRFPPSIGMYRDAVRETISEHKGTGEKSRSYGSLGAANIWENGLLVTVSR